MRLLNSSMFAFLLLSSCLDGTECSPSFVFASQFGYQVDARERTPSGIHVDRTGQEYPSLEMIDRLVDDVETCIIDKFGDPPSFPDDVRAAYGCRYADVTLPKHACITVKIPADWFLSKNEEQELLSYAGPNAGCKQKNPDHEPSDGCFWRAGLQCSTTVTSTPSMYVFKDPLIRLMTGCNNPWAVSISEDGSSVDLDKDLPREKRLVECASPGTSDVPARSPLPGIQRPEGFLGYPAPQGSLLRIPLTKTRPSWSGLF